MHRDSRERTEDCAGFPKEAKLMQLLCKPVCQPILVRFSPATSLEPSLTKRKRDMQSCVCPALMEWVQSKFNLSARHPRSFILGCFPKLPQFCFSPSHLLFPPPENSTAGLPLLHVLFLGKFLLFAAGHCETEEEVEEEGIK